ncbi:MAG TPA: hypothetical protein VMS65_15890 [Polyangiaceae bacterium]|nr:hypothetical protein [Polyangiaceae bacterium]
MSTEVVSTEGVSTDVSTGEVIAARAEVSVAPVPSVAPEAPSDVDFPDFQRRKRGRKTFAALVGSAAVLVAASAGWSQLANRRNAPSAAVAARAPERRAPERAPEPPSPKPVPPPATPAANEAVNTPAPPPAGAVGSSPEKAVTTVAVTIKTVPEEAVIFRAGQRIGAGLVEVNVERNTKQRFTALHDGYTPSNFTLDGSRDSITIRLKRAPKPQPAPAPDSDSPYGDPNVNSAPASATPVAPATTAASPTPAAPAPESTTPATPSPDVSSPASAPE